MQQSLSPRVSPLIVVAMVFFQLVVASCDGSDQTPQVFVEVNFTGNIPQDAVKPYYVKADPSAAQLYNFCQMIGAFQSQKGRIIILRKEMTTYKRFVIDLLRLAREHPDSRVFSLKSGDTVVITEPDFY